MKQKINIAELLKDCPSGMELDCTMYDNLYFDCIREHAIYPIVCYTVDSEGEKYEITFHWYGKCALIDTAKCVIFPKGKTTWEGFVPPCEFKDGDILYCDANDYGENDDDFKYIFIFDKLEDGKYYYSHCHLGGSEFYDDKTYLVEDYPIRFATEEEKQKLFQAIKDNGYKWNSETKTLEKLIEPKFKMGDRIKHRLTGDVHVVLSVISNGYGGGVYDVAVTNEIGKSIDIADQDEWELVPNKFDINTLVPFESRVLVRTTNDDIWRPAIYGFANSDRYYIVGGIYWKRCIPYEGNEHLLGTTDDCNEYYKTWEN